MLSAIALEKPANRRKRTQLQAEIERGPRRVCEPQRYILFEALEPFFETPYHRAEHVAMSAPPA
jgi:hypothetical protein